MNGLATILSSTSDLWDEYFTAISGGVSPTYDIDNPNAVLSWFMFRACGIFESLNLLWNKGSADEARILFRALLECHFQLEYISQDPEQRARQYVGFGPVDLSNAIRKARISLPEHFEEAFGQRQAEIKAIENEATTILEGAETRTFWWGDTIGNLIKKIDEAPKRGLGLLYAEASQYAHSTPLRFLSDVSHSSSGSRAALMQQKADLQVRILSACIVLDMIEATGPRLLPADR